jgi:hypothetical protein
VAESLNPMDLRSTESHALQNMMLYVPQNTARIAKKLSFCVKSVHQPIFNLFLFVSPPTYPSSYSSSSNSSSATSSSVAV